MGRRDPVEEDQAEAEPILITMDQAAYLAQVSRDRVREWMQEDGFPMIRTPRQVRIHLQLYRDWLASRAVRS